MSGIPSTRGNIYQNRDASPSNGLRVDLYKWLYPETIREDQENAPTFLVDHWDNDGIEWDADGAVWDREGPFPLLQNFLYAIEQMEVVELETLEVLKTITDPDSAPLEVLPIMAKHLDGAVSADSAEAIQRTVLRAISRVHDIKGSDLSVDAGFRMIGLRARTYPLYKKELYQRRLDGRNLTYSLEKYQTGVVEGEVVGIAGLFSYVGGLRGGRCKPGSVVFKTSTETWRDMKNGILVGNQGGYGTIDYTEGNFTLVSLAATSSQVTADYEFVEEYFPFYAARVDLDVIVEQDRSSAKTDLTASNTDAAEETLSRSIDGTVVDSFKRIADKSLPIHVRVRTFGVVALHHDHLHAFVGEPPCGPTRLEDDRRDFVNTPPDFRMHFGEEEITSADGLDIFQDTSSYSVGGVQPNTTEYDRLMEEDQINLCPTSDDLVIDDGSGTLQYW